MRVLHLSQADDGGGAAIAARRLHDALVAAGADSHMMVIRRISDDPRITAPLGSRGALQVRAARFFAKRLARAGARSDPTAMRTLGLWRSGLGVAVERFRADVVHMHWVGGETMSLGEIARITTPLVWTLHDMWPFCGAAHYDSEGRSAPGSFDIDLWTLRRKVRAWRDFDPLFICPSGWMAERLSRSPFFAKKARAIVPNTLDLAVFRPQDKAPARRAMGLPEGSLLLFGALGGGADPRKGGDLLADVARCLSDRGIRSTLAVFGGPAPSGLALPVVELGVLRDPHKLAQAYAAADIFIAPSRVDNLPNTVLEAQACGTPAVAFDAGGMPEAVAAPERLAPAFDCGALAAIIARILAAPPDRMAVRAHTAMRVAPDQVVRSHLELYCEAIARRRGACGRDHGQADRVAAPFGTEAHHVR